MDSRLTSTIDHYLQAAEKQLISANTLRQLMIEKENRELFHQDIKKSFEQKIEEATTYEEVGRLVKEQMEAEFLEAELNDNNTVQFDKYAKPYARKRTQSLPREEQLIEGSGEPFTPPVSTEDVAGL